MKIPLTFSGTSSSLLIPLYKKAINLPQVHESFYSPDRPPKFNVEVRKYDRAHDALGAIIEHRTFDNPTDTFNWAGTFIGPEIAVTINARFGHFGPPILDNEVERDSFARKWIDEHHKESNAGDDTVEIPVPNSHGAWIGWISCDGADLEIHAIHASRWIMTYLDTDQALHYNGAESEKVNIETGEPE